jgi:hypothetical protein
MFYNGWTHGHYVSNIFVFMMDGTIRICSIDAPGTMHNSSVSNYNFVYDKWKEVYQLMGGKVVINSVFCAGAVHFCQICPNSTNGQWKCSSKGKICYICLAISRMGDEAVPIILPSDQG